VERIEQLDTELQELNEQKKEVFAEAKGEGFDVKVLKEIIKLASRTRTSATSTKPCSTSTCAPWHQPSHSPSPKRRRAVHLTSRAWIARQRSVLCGRAGVGFSRGLAQSDGL
jgi:hypothetical protein